MRRTVREIFARYGAIAVGVYFAIFFAVLFGFWASIHFGWRPASSSGQVGAFTAAYIATKVTQPLRIAATLALTPLLAKVYDRVTGRRSSPPIL
ncbi:MAG: FAM210A/B-like domain-containing protein [Gemmatimonadaceae bacterium]